MKNVLNGQFVVFEVVKNHQTVRVTKFCLCQKNQNYPLKPKILTKKNV